MRIIAGIHKNRSLIAPKGQKTRPTSEKLRGSLFNICQNSIQDASFLDLFAGSGAMGLEALSRGAANSTFVDDSRESIRCIKDNIAKLKLDHSAIVMGGDVFHILEKLVRQHCKYDIIYADPPYAAQEIFKGKLMALSQYVLQIVDEMALLKPNGLLFIEDSVDSIPKTEGLKNLKFINARKMGKSALQQFRIKTEFDVPLAEIRVCLESPIEM